MTSFGEPCLVRIGGDLAYLLEGRFVFTALRKLVAQQAAQNIEPITILAEVFRMLFEHCALIILDAVLLPRLRETFLNERFRDRVAKDSQRIRGILPELPIVVLGRMSCLLEIRCLWRWGTGGGSTGQCKEWRN
ncbi:MAG: hypothetical protein AVDCRST_MAG93-9933 [uncultured Chloroflexia bacterium]|uniref:Uncharacterized protein n=1 Tax=uncultured Chloroflexia bacterium TaxID=1672391 RepID=A0A6J4NTC8_9CHLR|nr:MAG: hypothetical protein AVDCRST_MAG93-9933 [uncultured Chloroflexia bacterium]